MPQPQNVVCVTLRNCGDGSDDPGSEDMFTLPLESSEPSSRGNLTCRGKERKRRTLPISERLLSFVGQSSRIKIQNTQLWVIPKTIKKKKNWDPLPVWHSV